MAPTVRHLRDAHAQLLFGASPRPEQHFGGSEPAWLRVGSAPEADWRIEAPGLAPVHCELLWDGQGLYVQDRWRLGGTFVDGARVDDWLGLAGDVLIYLASACLRTRAPRDQAPEPRPEVLRWVQEQLLACNHADPTWAS